MYLSLLSVICDSCVWHFPLGLEFSVDSVKSFTIPFAVIENYTTVKEAIYLARLEVNLQVIKQICLSMSN